MESVFLRFESYDFEADLRFQDQVQDQVQVQVPGLKDCNQETRLLDLKLFFYNRFVEPIDRSSYQQWSSAPPRGVEQLDQRTRSDAEIGPNRTAETEVKQLSFAEVMRLVQEGKEVPGAAQLDIQATNQSPTPSQMQRRPKPWEISSVPK